MSKPNAADEQGKILDVEESNRIAGRNNVETGVIRKKNNKVLNLILFVVALVIIGGFVGYTVFSHDELIEDNTAVKQDEALLNADSSANSLAAQMAEIKRLDEERARLQKEAEEAERQRKAAEAAQAAQAQQDSEAVESRLNDNAEISPANDGEQPMTPAQRRLTGSILVQNQDGQRADQERDGGNDPEGIDSRLRGDVYARGTAKFVRNRNLLLIHGTQIPCVLQTRLVTDQPSILICQVTKNIYSADGSTLLIERGSKVFGEQRRAIITGQAMAFVNWSEIDTPYGVRVRIDSLGTDNLGASGLNVWVDEKWGKRFGGAILLSFIQDALASASQAAARNSNGNVVYDNSEQNTGRMAEIALENSINIQPTGYANQGQQINILVARDIDFTGIYKVK